MLNVLVILAAIAPVAVVIWYIYRKDRKQPEPTKLLIKAFIYGILSALLTLMIVIPFEAIAEFSNDEISTIGNAIFNAFFMAAIPEELAKLVMLWLLLRNNPYFDEHFDGIVYAVCIGMGFAAIENVLYLFDNYKSWISVGIARALFAVPGHFLDAVIMGFYYSLWHFRNRAQLADMRIDTRRSYSGPRHIRQHSILHEYRRLIKRHSPPAVPPVPQQTQEYMQKAHR